MDHLKGRWLLTAYCHPSLEMMVANRLRFMIESVDSCLTNFFWAVKELLHYLSEAVRPHNLVACCDSLARSCADEVVGLLDDICALSNQVSKCYQSTGELELLGWLSASLLYRYRKTAWRKIIQFPLFSTPKQSRVASPLPEPAHHPQKGYLQLVSSSREVSVQF